MRQVVGLLKVIGKAQLIDFYNQLLSYGTIQGAKLPSLNEFLATSLGSDQNQDSGFDSETDKAFEEIALKRLRERQAHNGQ